MRILLLSTTTGYQLRSFGEAAERLGVELLLGTDRCRHLDDPWRDGAIPVRFHDDDASMRAIEAAARERAIAGVVAVGDRPTVLAARAAAALGLPGNPLAAAAVTRSKKAMRRAFSEAGLRTPWFIELPAEADPQTIAAKIHYPCVVKPLGLSGSRGVIRADTPAQFLYAVGRIRDLLARPELRAQRTGLDNELIVEGYLEGREYAVEGLLTRGELRVLAVFDKPDPLDGPFFEETIYLTPPAIPWDLQHAIADEIQRATAAIGLVHGAVHAECRVGPAGVVMLEVASRPIGGICSRVLRFETGRETASLEEVLLRHARGDDVSPYVREAQAAGVMMIPIPKRGIFKGVRGEADARRVPYVEDVRITAKPDQLIEPLPEGDSYLGFIFARAAEADTAAGALRSAHKRLAFDIDPPLTVIRS
ncbi:MAG: ATP-grasp domain-containing protein [Vicinamibacterales bacterium]